jgi:hypothetical protein
MAVVSVAALRAALSEKFYSMISDIRKTCLAHRTDHSSARLELTISYNCRYLALRLATSMKLSSSLRSCTESMNDPESQEKRSARA